MIRVNLLRNAGLATAGTQMGSAIGGGELVSVDVRRQAGIKLGVILLFPLLLFVWESIRISALDSERAQLQQRTDTIEAEKASFGSAAPRVEKANKLKEKIETQIKEIRELAKSRLREVKALDQLQSVLPPGTWIREIDTIGGRVIMQGYAVNESGITELLNALNSNLFFSAVVPKGTQQESNPSLGNVTKFIIEFRVGRKEE